MRNTQENLFASFKKDLDSFNRMKWFLPLGGRMVLQFCNIFVVYPFNDDNVYVYNNDVNDLFCKIDAI